jgi:monoamine oxidase
VRAETPDGAVAARAAVVTAAPPAIAAGRLGFRPALPADKLSAARELRLGDALVVVARAITPAPASTWTLVAGERASFWETRAGSRRIMGWFTGPSARAAAAAPLEAATAALDWLDAGDLQSVSVADWGADPFAGGGYSFPRARHLSAGATWARGVGGVLHFAGEATMTGREPPLVDAAIDSGRRAARRALGALA